MHAVIVHVTINDPDAAQKALQEQVVPRVSQAPGFVAGYWCSTGPGKGESMVIFESEDAAQAASQQIQPPGDFVSFDSVQVGEVMASA